MLLTVHRDGEPRRDVRVTIPGSATTVRELSEALGFGGDPIVVDGRRLAPTIPISEARVWDGAEVHAGAKTTQGEANDEPNDAVVALDQVAGLSSGGSIELAPGHYRFGQSAVESGALALGEVADLSLIHI